MENDNKFCIFISELVNHKMLKINDMENIDKLNFILRIHNENYTIEALKTELQEIYSYNFEMKNERNFFKQNSYMACDCISYDVGELSSFIGEIISKELDNEIQRFAFRNLTIKNISENKWKLNLILYFAYQHYEIEIEMYKTDFNKFKIYIKWWGKIN